MGKVGAYLSIARHEHGMRASADAVADFDDIVVDLPVDEQRCQASRCMNCGVPFCRSGLAFNDARRATGCPLHNLIPETNDLLYRGRMGEAAARLSLTNPFPEFTGRVCPAPCETACNLGLHDEPVTIHDNERAISDWAWEGGMAPLPAAAEDAPTASVVGSGPAGLAAAWELARCGFRVRVYERDERPGGLLMYGIPNMKLPKWVVERRVRLMQESGIEFLCGIDAAPLAGDIAAQSDAVVLACGSRNPRRVDVPGADLTGIHFAVDYLSEATRALLEGRQPRISAAGKDVAVIGGGDTGVDCVATALRQGARSVRQIIRAKRPPAENASPFAWPGPIEVYRQGYGQREAAELLGEDPRLWATDTIGFSDDGDGAVSAVQTKSIGTQGDTRVIPAQIVLIAKGFTGPEQGVLQAFSEFGNVHPAGDARLGSTLVATAISDALQVAQRIVRAHGR
jgi:glutamate synthase (NADPH/NADH) small chain